MNNPNRIDPTAAPSTAPLAVADVAAVPFWRRPWFRRAVGSVVGAALAASCQFLPAPMNLICTAVASQVAQLSQTIDFGPSPAPVPASVDAGR